MFAFPLPASVVLWIVGAFLTVATLSDLLTLRIPNWLNWSFLSSGLVYSAVCHGASGVGLGIIGALVAASPAAIGFTLRKSGAGDVKLMAAVGIWLGPWYGLVTALLASVSGGFIAFVLVLTQTQKAKSIDDLKTGERRVGRAVPFGLAILLGYVVLLLAARLQ